MSLRWILPGLTVALLGCERQALELLPLSRDAGLDASPSVALADVRVEAEPEAAAPAECPRRCSDSKPICDSVFQRCVQCLEDRHCPDGYVCDRVTGRCAVPCREDSHCYKWRCNPDRQVCVECLGDSDCRNHYDDNTCRTTTGDCVECLSKSDCPSSMPVCDDDYQCVQCERDSDCGVPGAFCDHGLCYIRISQ